MRDKNRRASDSPHSPGRHREISEFERRAWQHWFLMVGVTILTTIGLGTFILQFLAAKILSLWPWPGTETALVAGLSLLVLVFASYLTQQQRQLLALRRELDRTREESAAQVRKHYERLLAVYTVSQTVASETKPEAVFDRIVRICLDTFRCEQVSLMLLDPSRKELEVRSAVGHPDATVVLGARQALGEGVAGWVAEHREALLLGPDLDAGAFRDFRPKAAPASAAMVVPILLREELVGVLSVGSRSPEISYDQEDLQALLVFAEHAGICIRHTEQTQWMRETNRGLEATLLDLEARTRREAA